MRSHAALLSLKFPLLLSAALVFGLAACSDEPDAAAAGGPPGGSIPVVSRKNGYLRALDDGAHGETVSRPV